MNRFWVGGTGNWDATTTHWSATSGGAGGASVPTSADDVFFDTSSSTANAAYTVTISAVAICKGLSIDGPSPTDATRVTITGTYVIQSYGDISFIGSTSGISNNWTGSLFTTKSGIQNLNTYGVPLTSITINSSACVLTLLSDITLSSQFNISSNGSFNANGYGVTLSSTGTTTINGNFTGSNSFYNLTRSQAVGSSSTVPKLNLSTNIAVTNNLTITGYNVTDRVQVVSSIIGTQRTITCTGASVNYSNVDFQDISISGGTLGTNSNVGDQGGNSGITFTTAVTQTWNNVNGGNWGDVANWTGSPARVPLPQDNVVINTAFGSAKTISLNTLAECKNIDFTGSTYTTSLTISFAHGSGFNIYGSFTGINGVSYSGTYTTFNLCGRGNYNLDTKGTNFPRYLNINAPTGNYTMQSNWYANSTSYGVTINNGTLSCNGYYIKAANFKTLSGTTVNFGSATHEILGATATAWSVNTGSTVNADTSTIKFTHDATNAALTFAGGGKTYNIVWFARPTNTGTITITGDNTFNTLKNTGGGTHSFVISASTTQTVSNFIMSGSASNTITLNSSTLTPHNLVKVGGGVVSCDYLNIQHSVATPSNTWYAGTHSVDNQSVATAGSGWIFTDPPVGGATSNALIFNNIF